MKKHIFLMTLVGTFLFLQSCTVGYVARPNEIRIIRPANPSRTQILIDRGNSRTRTYVVRPGYSGQAKRSRTYVSGHWAPGPKGRYWVRGHWR